MGLLQRERRVTYRELKHVFILNDPLVAEIREELTFKQLARDEAGKGLVWTGEAQPAVQREAVTCNPQILHFRPIGACQPVNSCQ
jgi:hypothetical protein